MPPGSRQGDPRRTFHGAPRPPVAIDTVLAYVARHPAEPLDLAAAARVAGLHKNYFCGLFRATLGMGFPAWLVRHRIALAADLLLETDLPVRRVARRVGFTNLRTFQRSFKLWRGVSAGEYRRRGRAATT